MEPRKATIFLVDDDPAILKALAWLFRSAGYTVAAFNAPHRFLEAAPGAGPACAVLDLQMPGMSGLELQAELRRTGCAMPLVFVTGHGDVRSSVHAMKDGAVDFLLKPVDDEELLAAVERALERGAREREEREEHAALEARFEALTPREREVCELMAQGLLNKQIAAGLHLSEPTVKQYRAHVLEKLGVESAAEAACMLTRLRQRRGAVKAS